MSAPGVTLDVSPTDGPVDELPRIVVGSEPEHDVTLTNEVVDAAGPPWRSTATFRADLDGAVDLHRDAPVHGDYTGVDPSGPWWAMRFADADAAPVAFTAPTDELTYRCTASGSGTASTVAVRRRWAAAAPERLTGDGYRGLCFAPPHAGVAPGVVVVPGSTGVAAMAPLAGLLARRGYRTMVLGYQQEPGLPDSLCEIPLEHLLAGMRALASRDDIDPNRLGVVCVSVGTAGALAALAHDGPPVAAAVAIAPSSVVWQALASRGRPPSTSSWSLAGRPLPWVPIKGERLLPELARHTIGGWLHRRRPRPHALHLRPAYAAGLAETARVGPATIPVERIAAPLLLLAGSEDAMWPSTTMAEHIATRRREHGVDQRDRYLALPGAGHFLGPPITPTTVAWNAELVSGGSPAGNAAAQRSGWDALCAFLHEHLPAGTSDVG